MLSHYFSCSDAVKENSWVTDICRFTGMLINAAQKTKKDLDGFTTSGNSIIAYHCNNLLPLTLIAIAPRGAVITMDNTAKESIKSPDSTPIDSGIAPIAA